MTCIIALEHNGKVYMGGDSAAATGWSINVVANPKVFVLNDFIIGYTSSFRMGQLLEYTLEIPENTDGEDDLRYLVSKFIPAVRDCLKSGGYATINNNAESGGFFLIGYRGKAYKVADDFQITRMSGPFIAVGAGEYLAMGAMAALPSANPKKRVLQALEIAALFNNGVRGPFYVVTL
jgi:ATP-dependent protease HslVU (ClpYQ) peptidase subunit